MGMADAEAGGDSALGAEGPGHVMLEQDGGGGRTPALHRDVRDTQRRQGHTETSGTHRDLRDTVWAAVGATGYSSKGQAAPVKTRLLFSRTFCC